jgi:hypothetical protein
MRYSGATSSQARLHWRSIVSTTCCSIESENLTINYLGSLARPEKRYTAMSVTFRGQEILELITDSEGEY